MPVPRIPDRLAALLDHADKATAAADVLMYRARLLITARVLRDRFPAAAVVRVDSQFLHLDPVGVEVEGIEAADGTLLWGNGCPHATGYPCDACQDFDDGYRTTDHASWQDVITHAAGNLTAALCGGRPGDRWPRHPGTTFVYRVALPEENLPDTRGKR